MRPVSAAFLRTVHGSHVARFRAVLCEDYQTGLDPAGTVVPIVAGTVSMDATADSRSTLDLTTEASWWPQDATDLLAPYGNELFIQRGVEVAGGATEWVSLGYFRLYSAGQSGAPTGAVRLTGKDRMSAVVDSRTLSPVQFMGSQTVRQMVETLVLQVLPAAAIGYDFDPDALTLGRTIVVEQDRYPALLDLARSLGKVCYWDHTGTLQLKSPPDPASPVFSVTAGQDGVLVSLDRELAREGIYNAVVATGEAADNKAPARGVARDMNPASPTFWPGRFGQVPRFYSSPLITTTSQARAAAGTMLGRALGAPYQIDLTFVPNPALEPLDPVLVSLPDGRQEVHTMQTLDVGLTADTAMTGTTKDQTDQDVEESDT